MIFNYLMPTRILWGENTLASIGTVTAGLGVRKILVVTDPVIGAQRFFADAADALRDAGLSLAEFDECDIDARLSHIDQQSARCRKDGIEAIVCIGGGSVMCTGKGVAIVAANGTTLREHLGAGNFSKQALPMVMVPTTAGSGSEVSQYLTLKDDERDLKLLAGGPLSFPTVAILDPVVLSTLPKRAAILPAVDALTHAIEAYFSDLATPLTDALALESAALQASSMRASILDGDVTARSRNLLASSMSNIACGNARLGHAHALSLPLEGHLHLAHPLGVGTLIPWTMQFNARAAPEKGRRMAEALGAETRGLSDGEAPASRSRRDLPSLRRHRLSKASYRRTASARALYRHGEIRRAGNVRAADARAHRYGHGRRRAGDPQNDGGPNGRDLRARSRLLTGRTALGSGMGEQEGTR